MIVSIVKDLGQCTKFSSIIEFTMALLARFDDVEAASGISSRQHEKSGTCFRCKIKQTNIILRRDYFCEECSAIVIGQRIRRSVSGPPQVGREIMLSIGGDDGSLVGLDMATQIMHCGRKRRWWARASIVYVDTASVSELWDSPESKDLFTSEMFKLIIASGINAYIVPVETAYAPQLQVFPIQADQWELSVPDVQPTIPSTMGDQEQIEKKLALALESYRRFKSSNDLVMAARHLDGLFREVAFLDSKSNLLKALRKRLTIQVTNHLNIPYLASFESADSMAQSIITSMCLGGGFNLPFHVSPVDVRFSNGLPFSSPTIMQASPDDSDKLEPLSALTHNWYDCTIQATQTDEVPQGGLVFVKPLIEIEGKEVKLYRKVKGIGSALPNFPSFSSMKGTKGSVEALSTNVVDSLQGSYQSSVHNVVRTMRKIVVPPVVQGQSHFCCMCYSVVPPSSMNDSFLSCNKEADGQHFCRPCGELVDTIEGVQP